MQKRNSWHSAERKIERSNPTSTKPLKTCRLMTEIDQIMEAVSDTFSGEKPCHLCDKIAEVMS